METNTAEKKKRRVYLKPLNPRPTAEDRLDADLRLLSRALRAWERRMRLTGNFGFSEFRQENE